MAKLLRELKGVGEKTEKLFQKIGITTTDDLLHYYPRNYDAFEAPVDIADLEEGTVKSRLARAREQLRRALEEAGNKTPSAPSKKAERG